jgi:hypothetical protein
MKHHARYALPGSFLNESDSRELSDRSADAAVARAPERAFAFVLYDTAEVDFEYDPNLFRVTPRPQNESGRHYIGGETFTPDELRQLATDEGEPGKYDVLIANVEGNGWGRAIRTRAGNWQPFEEGDVLVEATTALHGEGQRAPEPRKGPSRA